MSNEILLSPKASVTLEIDDVLDTSFVRDLIQSTCGDDITLVARSNSFAVRSRVEGDRDVHRVILLPPRGYTANRFNQMNSHDEAEKATIEVKGAVVAGKQGFSKNGNALRVVSHGDDGRVSQLTQPYLTFNQSSVNSPDYTFQTHVAGAAPFAVVKNDGFGFYHNLINLTDKWLALRLHKVLRPQKKVDLTPHLESLSSSQQKSIKTFYKAIVEYGDNIFKEAPDVVSAVVAMPVDKSLPALMDMLHVHDSGMHEACTVFGTILKIGKKESQAEQVIKILGQGVEAGAVPTYYAEQLSGKLNDSKTLTQAADLSHTVSNENNRRARGRGSLPVSTYS